jgi:hypothetical protein
MTLRANSTTASKDDGVERTFHSVLTSDRDFLQRHVRPIVRKFKSSHGKVSRAGSTRETPQMFQRFVARLFNVKIDGEPSVLNWCDSDNSCERGKGSLRCADRFRWSIADHSPKHEFLQKFLPVNQPVRVTNRRAPASSFATLPRLVMIYEEIGG